MCICLQNWPEDSLRGSILEDCDPGYEGLVCLQCIDGATQLTALPAIFFDHLEPTSLDRSIFFPTRLFDLKLKEMIVAIILYHDFSLCSYSPTGCCLSIEMAGVPKNSEKKIACDPCTFMFQAIRW